MASIEYDRYRAVILSQAPAVFEKQELIAGVYVVRIMADADDFAAGPSPMVELMVSQPP